MGDDAAKADRRALRVAVSYAREDGRVVEAIVALLKGLGLPTFVDRDLVPGAKWQIEIEASIEAASHVIVFWSSHAAVSDHVRKEIEIATREGAGRVVIPARIDATPLPPTLSGIQELQLADLKAP